MQTPLPRHLGLICTLLSHASSLGLVLLGVLYVYVMVDPAALVPPVDTVTGFTPLKRGGLAIVFAIVLIPAAVALWALRGLFARYGRGQVLSFANAAAIRRVGAALLAGVGLTILGRTASVLILTHDNPPGQRSFAVSLAGHDYIYALLGALLVVIGWVLVEATRAAQENREFV